MDYTGYQRNQTKASLSPSLLKLALAFNIIRRPPLHPIWHFRRRVKRKWPGRLRQKKIGNDNNFRVRGITRCNFVTSSVWLRRSINNNSDDDDNNNSKKKFTHSIIFYHSIFTVRAILSSKTVIQLCSIERPHVDLKSSAIFSNNNNSNNNNNNKSPITPIRLSTPTQSTCSLVQHCRNMTTSPYFSLLLLLLLLFLVSPHYFDVSSAAAVCHSAAHVERPTHYTSR